jgi:general secretion pathway protein K
VKPPRPATARLPRHRRPAARPAGSALVIVLWVIALLSVLIGGFAFDMHIEARIVSHLRKKLKAEYLARAGLEYALVLLARSAEVKGKGDREDLQAKWWYADAKRLKQGYAIVGKTEPLGEGVFVLEIVPEPALRNINRLKDEDWERIFQVGGIPEERWSELIDSFNDWRDGDDQPNLDGAETDDYYAKLTPPYKARGRQGKQANLDTVEELLLIKGFDRAILNGGYADENDTNGVYMSGIADLLTAIPQADDKVNVNAASRRALRTLPGIDDPLAEAIIEEREGLTGNKGMDEDSNFTDVNNLFARVPRLSQLSPAEQQYLRTLVSTVSPVYRVTSTGRVKGVEYKLVSVLLLAQ